MQANQLLPLFNKGIRKFTRVFKEVFERDIARQLDQESKGVPAVLNKQSADLKKSLHEELKEGETQLTRKMKEEKEEFIKRFAKHQIKSTDEDFDKALASKTAEVSVISVKKHKGEDVEGLEEKVKKAKSSKRQKHND